MSDDEIIDQIAWLWIKLGGDSEGFDYCKRKITDRIRDLEDK